MKPQSFQQIVRTLRHTITDYLFSDNATQLNHNSSLSILLAQGKDRILTVMLRLSAVLGLFGILSMMGPMLKAQRYGLILLYLGSMSAIGIISYLRHINYTFRAVLFLSIIYALGSIDLSNFGVAEDWRLYFSAFTVLATLFLGWRWGIAALFASLITIVAISWQIAAGRIVITASSMVSPIPNLESIFIYSIVFVMVNGVIIAAISALLYEFETAHKNERVAIQQLGKRTAELEHSLNREKELARKLAFALQQEEELSQLRSKIITTVSHEFRTPLAIINTSVEILNQYYERLSKEKRQAQYDRIHNAIFYLTGLMQDITLVESAKEDTVLYQPKPISFDILFQQLETDLRQATNKPVNMHIDGSGDSKKQLVVDYQLLKQIVLNLLTNALKFSPSNELLTISIELASQLTITVTDKGIGVLSADKDKIWDLFYRGQNVEMRSGLGLGLFIVQQLLETMSGSIAVQDNPDGDGTSFIVQLPISANH